MTTCGDMIRGNDEWIQEAPLPGEARFGAFAFQAGGRAYLGGGAGAFGQIAQGDVFEFDPDRETQWQELDEFFPSRRIYPIFASLGQKGIMGWGSLSVNVNNVSSGIIAAVYEYDPGIPDWIRLENYSEGPRVGATSFVIGQKWYIFTGEGDVEDINGQIVGRELINDLLEFDLNQNTQNPWFRRPAFNEIPRVNAVAFSKNGRGFLCTGFSGETELSDVWEYTPIQN